MASKRVATTAVNWAEFAKKIPAANKGAFQALKNKQDGYLRTIGQLPETLPAIDFAAYKGRIAGGKIIVVIIRLLLPYYASHIYNVPGIQNYYPCFCTHL